MDKPKLLYHGSGARIEVLMPQEGHDMWGEAGSQLGVFATWHRDLALAFALGAVPNETGRVTRVVFSLDPLQMIYVEGHPNLGSKGCLYTLSTEAFEEVDQFQWICREPVKPMETVEIDIDDYSHLWRYATEEDLRQIQRESDQSKTSESNPRSTEANKQTG